MHRLILASQSPRRSELLRRDGFQFQVIPLQVSEIPDKKLTVPEQILDIAARKARAAVEALDTAKHPPYVVLAADTEVIFEGKPMGKPETSALAADFLRRLSGSKHEVVTAVCMIEGPGGRQFSHLETSQILFRSLSEDEIQAYVQTGEPLDKAGAYAIQGGGRAFVASLVGDFDNVVGLPMAAVRLMMKKGGWVWTN